MGIGIGGIACSFVMIWHFLYRRRSGRSVGSPVATPRDPVEPGPPVRVSTELMTSVIYDLMFAEGHDG